MSEIKIGTGNGQGSCYGCEQKGKWNRNWITFLYEYDGELWCEDCLIEKLNKENQELKKQQKEYIEQLEKLAHQYMISSDFANGCKVAYGIALNRYKEIIGGDNK